MRGWAGLTAALALLDGHLALAQEAPAKAPPASERATVAEVVVRAKRPVAQTLIDRKVYRVSGDLQTTTGTAADVLNTVPSVTVDADGAVALRGDGNVTILVDGKPSAQFSGATAGAALQQMSASDIDRVEVLTTPPAQYKAEGTGGVINIVTKKVRRDGLSGTAQLSLGDKRRYVAAVSVSETIGKLKLSGGLTLRQDARERLVHSARVVIDPTTHSPVASRQGLDETVRRLTPSVHIGADYELGARQSLSATVDHREQTGNRYFDQTDAAGPAGGADDSRSTRHSDGHEWSLEANEGLRFDQKLSRPGETFSLALQHSATREREGYRYRNDALLPTGPPSFDDLHLSLDLVTTEISADYDLPLSHDRDLKLGYDYQRDRNRFDNSGGNLDPASGLFITNPDVTDRFRYRDDIHALYAQYEAPLGAWRLQAGLRYESARAKTFQITGDVPGGRHDAGFYPSLHLDRDMGEHGKLFAGVSRRLTRPDPEALNPFTDHQDIHNLRAGNPDLAPQQTWSYEAGYTGEFGALAYGATAYLRQDRNRVTDVLRPISDDVVLATKANLPKSRAVGLELTASGKLGPKLSYSLSGDLFNAQIDATSLGFPGLKSTTGVNLKASLDWRPTRADTAQISLSRVDRRLTPQGDLAAVTLVNLGYRRQLRPDLAMVFTISDAFNGQRLRRTIATATLTDAYERQQLGRLVYLGLVYTFGGQTKAKPRGFEYEQ